MYFQDVNLAKVVWTATQKDSVDGPQVTFGVATVIAA